LVCTFTGIGLAVVLELRAGLALIVIRTGTVEVFHQTVALGLVLARVRAARVTLHLRMHRWKDEWMNGWINRSFLCIKDKTRFVKGLDWTIAHLTGSASVSLWALTHEAVQQGVAPAPVSTRAAGTAVPLDLTVPAHKPR
jgi:hypothetical protein